MTIYEDSLNQQDIGEAWQYKVRMKYAELESGDKYWEDFDLSIQSSEVREITYTEAKAVIEKYEWLGCMPVCVKHCYGLYFPHKSQDRWLLGGVTVFSSEYAENTGVWDKYGFGNKIILLARGVCVHFCPKNANSHLIMESIKLLPTQYEVITCTVDNLAGEVGTIYQSCNFYYVGVMRKNKERIGCIIDGKLYGSRTLRQMFGTQDRKTITELFPTAKFIKQKAKGRYFYFRCDKRRKKEYLSAISGLLKPYPKRGVSICSNVFTAGSEQ